MNRPRFLLKTQGDELFRKVTEEGFDPTDFKWVAGSSTDMLTYQALETFFLIGGDKVVYSPGTRQLLEQWMVGNLLMVVQHFVLWLSNIKREAGPSLWESIAEGAKVSAGDLVTPRTLFTPEEQGAILAQLEEMRRQIAALVTQDQMRLIGAELRKIGDAVKRMERGEWWRFAIGSMMTVLLASDVQHSLAASLMQWAVSAFHTMMVGSPAPPLILPP